MSLPAIFVEGVLQRMRPQRGTVGCCCVGTVAILHGRPTEGLTPRRRPLHLLAFASWRESICIRRLFAGPSRLRVAEVVRRPDGVALVGVPLGRRRAEGPFFLTGRPVSKSLLSCRPFRNHVCHFGRLWFGNSLCGVSLFWEREAE